MLFMEGSNKVNQMKKKKTLPIDSYLIVLSSVCRFKKTISQGKSAMGERLSIGEMTGSFNG